MLKIQILGIGCKKSRALKANLLAALRAVSVEAFVEEVARVDDIVKYQILSTPALLINRRIVSEGSVPEIGELKKALLQSTKVSLAMKNILVPTDFSHIAANAFQYAMNVAKRFDSELTLLHVYHPFFDPDNPLAGSDKQQIEMTVQKKLDTFIGENISPSNNEDKEFIYKKLHKEFRYGFAADEITKYSNQFDLVVMGTTGDGDLLDHLFGSVSSHVAQYAHCRVLLVPEHAQFKDFDTVVFASDHLECDKLAIEELIDTMEIPGKNVHLVHIQENANEEYLVYNGKQDQICHTDKPVIELKQVEIISNNILNALHQYAASADAKLIILSATNRTLPQEIFHRSVTKRMILQAKTPLLVLHNR